MLLRAVDREYSSWDHDYSREEIGSPLRGCSVRWQACGAGGHPGQHCERDVARCDNSAA